MEDVNKYNKAIGILNVERDKQVTIVKKDYMSKSLKDYDAILKSLRDDISKSKLKIKELRDAIKEAERPKTPVETPVGSSGIVREVTNRLQSITSNVSESENSTQLTLREFEGYHEDIARDMTLTKYKGDIVMADVEFYSYDRSLVFRKIWERATAQGVIPTIRNTEFGKDVTTLSLYG